MAKRTLSVALMLVSCASPGFTLPCRANADDSKQVVERARAAYYSLKAQGMLEFRCNVQPDWDVMYKSLKPDAAATQELLPILQKTRFKVLVGPDGASTISHESDVVPPNEKVAERVRESVGGLEQVLTGFFQTWSGFVINPLIPAANSEYRMDDVGEKYRITSKDSTADVVTTMDHSFAIEQVEVTAPNLTATLRPTWSRGANGLLLTGYDASYKTTGAPGQLSVKIQYEVVQGLSLPSVVDATIPSANGPVTVRLNFKDYEVKKR